MFLRYCATLQVLCKHFVHITTQGCCDQEYVIVDCRVGSSISSHCAIEVQVGVVVHVGDRAVDSTSQHRGGQVHIIINQTIRTSVCPDGSITHSRRAGRTICISTQHSKDASCKISHGCIGGDGRVL